MLIALLLVADIVLTRRMTRAADRWLRATQKVTERMGYKPEASDADQT
ncbi:MAG TPA: hypothetical protein VGR63_02460 [Casimicrobiaceae bacterium]|nr:hypothetical protein [Casimicrobiaceae bacterium]